MVLCAVGPEHSSVKLVEPPVDAKVGDRVVFPGFAGEPATPSQVARTQPWAGSSQMFQARSVPGPAITLR